MVHNYLKRIGDYSDSSYPIGFFSYIAGGFGKTIDKQIQDEVRESGIHGSGIAVSNFIKMIENHQNGVRRYSHSDLRRIFSVDRQIMLKDIFADGYNSEGDYSDVGLSSVADSITRYSNTDG